jgi:hypothetical protein
LEDQGVDGIKTDLTEIRWEVAGWIYLDQDMYQWKAFVKRIMNIWVP